MVSPLRQSSEQSNQLTPLNVQSAREAGSVGQSLQQGLQVGQNFAINAQQNARANEAAALQAREAQVQTAVEEQRLAELQKRYAFLDTHLTMESKKAAVDLQVAEAQLRMQGIQEQLAKSRATYEDVQVQKTVSSMDPWQDENGDWHMTRAEPGGGVRSPVIAPNHPKVQEYQAREAARTGFYEARNQYYRSRQSGVSYAPTYKDLEGREKTLTTLLSGASTDPNSEDYIPPEERAAMGQELTDVRNKLRMMAKPADTGFAPPGAQPTTTSVPANDTGAARRRPPTVSDQLDVPNETGVMDQKRKAAVWSLAGKKAETSTSLGIPSQSLEATLPRFIKLMRDSGKDIDPTDPTGQRKQSDETLTMRLLDTLAGNDPDSQAMRSMFLKVVGK